MSKKLSESGAPLCPSYISKPGAQLFGIVADGRVIYLEKPITVNKIFVEEAAKGRTPESRFRFSGKCIEGGCKQWDGGRGVCGLTDKLIAAAGEKADAELQHCGIRTRCRWFMQRGATACAICSESVRNMEEAYLAQA